MLMLQGITYTHPNGKILFEGLNLVINKHDKTALTGNNGTGKSTLLKIIAGVLQPSAGTVSTDNKPYYVPQVFGQFNNYTVAEALCIADKLQALKQILAGNVTEANMVLLNDDWTIEERCTEALAHWQLNNISLEQKMSTLSGGQKTRVFLAGIAIHQPRIVLLDEPSNHLDTAGRQLLYDYIQTTRQTLLVVSHDRTLLNFLQTICELDKYGTTVYGGNYDFYTSQKQLERAALYEHIRDKEKAHRKAKKTERVTIERQQKLDARGRKKQEKAGMPAVMMKTLRNNAEKSTSKIKDVHAGKVEAAREELDELRRELPGIDKIKMAFDNSALHKGKVLVRAENINTGYNDKQLWQQAINFEILSGERIVIKGHNGSGKTTLIKLLLGKLHPSSGKLHLAIGNAVYIDQDYSLIGNNKSVYEQAEQYNHDKLQEHEVKTRLDRFLFTQNDWNKSCSSLSGGEKMRLMLCCLTIGSTAPDMIILDEPTNNLDIQNIEILTTAINEYSGTLIVVSHDEYFQEQVRVERVIEVSAGA